ncbi:hypothetical protein PPL_02194 [Heterostelium album PN500]|uniref:Uncharacterized protein n=1 Tax=Heterostelium pallidum (strain ATCC 26659 / Pp 5 / PN500) TaxID=670386 RepID=D3B1M0_HETP5|nr:hypothetical protein PPL_02194 [Heterostelium album PN500]EFA85194.1 hypothetical protein PPL_02194 [Heterostelium album PN500]|eukprot:XP_020437303.1 hypothetical protein PPL_02194 [Heterostelium album PN500]
MYNQYFVFIIVLLNLNLNFIQCNFIRNVYDQDGLTYIEGQFDYTNDNEMSVIVRYDGYSYFDLVEVTIQNDHTLLVVKLFQFDKPVTAYVKTELVASNTFTYTHNYNNNNDNSNNAGGNNDGGGNNSDSSQSSSSGDPYTPPYKHKAKPEITVVYIVISVLCSIGSLVVFFIAARQYRALSAYTLISMHDDPVDDNDDIEEEPYNFREYDDYDHKIINLDINEADSELEPTNYRA